MIRHNLLFLLSCPVMFGVTIAPVGSNGYYATDSVATFVSIGGSGTLIPGTAADDVTGNVTLPFPVTFYGLNFGTGSTITVSTNGNIQFAATGSTTLTNTTLSSVGPISAPTAFVYWDDLILTTPGGGVYTATTGSPGSRQFIVEWRGRRFGDGATTQNMNFQAVFFENSTDFVYNYGQTGIGGTANGASATVGAWQDNANYTEFSLNQPVITPNTSIRFSLTDPGAVPEPSSVSMILLAAGAAGLYRLRRR